MQFIIDNLFFVIVSIIVFGFAAFFIVKIIKEVSLNRLLRDKHSSMRIDIDYNKTSFVKRIGLLTSTALAPIAVVAIVVIVGINSGGLTSGNQLDLNSTSDILDIYDNYNDLLGDDYQYRTDDYTFTDSSLEDSADAPELDYALEPKYVVMSSTNVTGTDVIGESVQTEEALYQVDESYTNLFITSFSDAMDFPSNQQITYTSNTTNNDDCRREEYINGFYVTNESFIVITSEYSVGCLYEFEGYSTEEEFVLSTTDVNVYVYDNTAGLELDTIYTFDGILLGTLYKDNQLIVLTDSYIPYEKEGFLLDMHLPNYTVNSSGSSQTFGVHLNDILYVDGVLPNTFISLYSIEISTEEVSLEVLLVDDSFDIVVTNDSISLTTNIYYFEQASLVFDLDDPIDDLTRITFSYDITENITYVKYEIK